MKNCPGSPGSSPPCSMRRSVYGPTASRPATLRASRLGMAFLERERGLAARAGDGLGGRGRPGQRRDAGNPSDEGGLSNPVAVRAGARPLRRVDDEVAAAPADEVDDGGPVS